MVVDGRLVGGWVGEGVARQEAAVEEEGRGGPWSCWAKVLGCD